MFLFEFISSRKNNQSASNKEKCSEKTTRAV